MATWLDYFIQETLQFVEDYKKVKEELDIENKQLQELVVSYDTIKKYMAENDLQTISKLLDNKKEAVCELSQKQLKNDNILIGKKLTVIEHIKKLHDLYILLEKQGVFNEDASQDPFIVEMGKLLYPNAIDNQQLRQDPPIAGVFKSKNGIMTSSNASPVDNIKTIDIGASKCSWGGGPYDVNGL